MYLKKLNILIITDQKVSSKNQCDGLVNILKNKKKLRVNIKRKKIALKYIRKLPSFIIYILLKIKLINCSEFKEIRPDLVISCGRVAAPFNLYIKHLYNCKNIHILNPYMKYNKFDLIFIPKHDNLPKLKNIIKTRTSIVNKEKLIISKKESSLFNKYFKIPSTRKIVTILLGGDGGSGTLRTDDINKLVSYIKKEKDNNFFYCFLFSRRTNETMKEKIKENFNKTSYIWNETSPNPYWFLLKKSSYIVVTADSISMTSESIAAKKNVFVFFPKVLKPKVKKFQSLLLNEKITRKYYGSLYGYKNFKLVDDEQVITTNINERLLPSLMNP